MRKWTVVGSCLFITVVVVVWMLIPAQESVISVRVGKVERKTLEKTLAITGIVQAQDQREVFSPVAGVVSRVMVKEGQQVNEGDALFSLDCSAQEAQLSALVAACAAQEETVAVISDVGVENPIISQSINSLRAQIDALARSIAQSTLRAGQNGVLHYINLQEGDVVAPGIPVMLLGDSTQIIRGIIAEKDVPTVKVGQEARVKCDGRKIRATVNSIKRLPIVAGTPAQAEVIMTFQGAPLPFGAAVDGDLVTRQRKDVLCVTLESLGEEEDSVFVVRDGRAWLLPVTTSYEEGNYVEISGLLEGEEVVLCPPQTLQNSQCVQVQP